MVKHLTESSGRWALLIGLLFAATAAIAADLKIPTTATGKPGDFIQIKATTTGTTVKWVVLDPGLNVFPTDLLKDTKTAVVIGTTPGTYRVLAYTSDAAGPSDPAITSVTIAGTPPPGPAPGPAPGPGPSADLPFPGLGFKMLIVYDSSTVSQLTPAQQEILFSTPLRQYLNARCTQTGGNADYRIWDQSIDGTADGEMWSKAMKRPRKSLPWLVTTDGKTAYEGPLPANVKETMDILQQYGGKQ